MGIDPILPVVRYVLRTRKVGFARLWSRCAIVCAADHREMQEMEDKASTECRCESGRAWCMSNDGR